MGMVEGEAVLGVEPAGADDFAYIVSADKFVFRSKKGWDSTRLNEKGIINYLVDHGWTAKSAKKLIARCKYPKVYGEDLIPGEPPVYEGPNGLACLNTWIAPTLKPIPGPFPSIERVLDWVTEGDRHAQNWIIHWMAAKAQSPTLVLKVALVILTQPGGGKGTLGRIMREILGVENCAVVKRRDLDNKFNSRWAGKLFVLADEIVAKDDRKDLAEILKVLIDGDEIEYEAKHKAQSAIRNKLAWMFASNDFVNPLQIDPGDRRYTVVGNRQPLPEEYKTLLKSNFLPDKKDVPTERFLAEMSGFYAHLLSVDVDHALITNPFENELRKSLIDANRAPHERFMLALDAGEIDNLVNEYFPAQGTGRWDFGERGIKFEVIYRAYQEFAKRVGGRSIAESRFGAAMSSHHPVYPKKMVYVKELDKQVKTYVLPRKGKEAVGGEDV